MVEWKKIGDSCITITPPKKLEKELYNNEGPYPIIDQGQKEIVGYTDDKSALIPNGFYTLFGDHTRYVKFHVGQFAQGADGLKILKTIDSVLPRYFFYAFSNTEVPSRGYSRHWSIAKELLIPIPSFQEQNRIVGILDTFTASIDNLKEQIAQRRKQYEYYRDQLLDLEGKEGVEMKAMGDLFTFKNGLNKGKEYFGNGKPIIMFTNVFKSRYIDNSMVNNKVDISESELERINAHKGDVFFTRTSETKEEVGYASVLIEEIEECTFAGFLIRARPVTNTILPTYCKYCFSTPKIRDSIVSKSSFTTRASLTGTSLAEVKLYLPSLQEQQRIVSILDTFEASIQNLEAQLSQREKQYEYYRNKLLTFE